MRFDFPASVETIEAVPEAFRALYAEQDGMFVLNQDLAAKLTDLPPGLKSALEKERENVKAAKRQASELEAKVTELQSLVEGIGGEKGLDFLKSLAEKAKQDKAVEAFGNGDFEGAKRLLIAETEDHWKRKLEVVQQQIAGLEKERDNAKSALRDKMIEIEIRRACTEAAVKDGHEDIVIPYITAHHKLDYQDDKVVVLGPDDRPDVGPSGKDRTVVDLLTALRDQKTLDIFKPNTGPGAPGSAAKGRASEVNPWKRETFNLTDQARILKADAEKAKRMQVEAAGTR